MASAAGISGPRQNSGRELFFESVLKENPHLATRQPMQWRTIAVWIGALVIYTYAVSLTVSSTTPPCNCHEEAVSLFDSPTRIEYRDEIACDPVRWALWGSNGTSDDLESLPRSAAGRAVQIGHVNKGNMHADENPHAKRVADRYTFYAGIRGKSNNPPDRIAFAKFFAGSGFPGADIGVGGKRKKDKRNGIFVEVGVGDAVKNSLSLFFEKSLNWTGIIMEGATPNLETFRNSNRAKGTVKVAKAACSKEGTMTMVGSGFTAGLVDFLPKDHEQKNKKNWGKKWIKPYNVSCVTLRSVLAEQKLTHVDLLSIDVEGAEANVLEGLDFQKANVRVIVIDLPIPKPEKNRGKMEDQARSILLANKFCLCSRVGPLEYWTSDPELRRQHCGWNSFRRNP